MNVFQPHSQIIHDYVTHIRSSLNIADPKINELVESELDWRILWPELFLQFNPSFDLTASVEEFTKMSSFHLRFS